MITLDDGSCLINFDEKEFLYCCPPCMVENMNNSFLHRLQSARSRAGIPFHLNCAFRRRGYDLDKGRSGNSYHCQGRAVDIRCTDSLSRALIVKAALESGLYGIGIADNFIHLDDRPNPTIWLYE